MDHATLWRQLLATWPDDLPQRGVLVTNFGEQVNFVKFLLAEHVLMVERLAPDSVGGRRLLIPYDSIQAIKITDPVKDDIFLSSGYLPGGRSAGAKKKPDPASLRDRAPM